MLESFRFLDLPREIRDQIYRELLSSNKVYEPINQVDIGRRYRYQVAILCCSRQTNDEATPILYDENCFILFELNWKITDADIDECIDLPFCRVWPPPEFSLEPNPLKVLRQRVALNVRLEQTAEDSTTESTDFIVTPWELFLTTQLLSMPVRRRHTSLDGTWIPSNSWPWTCSLHLNLRGRHRRHLETLIDGLLGFDGLTNIRMVKTSGFDSPDAVRLSSLIPSNGYHIDECLARASALVERGDRSFFSRDSAQGFLAFKCYYECLAYLDGSCGHWPVGSTEEQIDELEGMRVWVNLACAICLLNQGQETAPYGRKWCNQWQPYLGLHSPNDVAKFSLYHSCLMLRRSFELKALYYLWFALRAWPGWSIAVDLINELDSRMQREPALKARISAAFHMLLEPARHQQPRRMTKEEYKEVEAVTKKELETAQQITGLFGLIETEDLMLNIHLGE